MNAAALVLRLVHIICGVYWAGTLLFVATMLQPSIADAGPEGGKVMQALMRRRFLEYIPIMALLTILSGIELMRRVSGGFSANWFGTTAGMVLSAGALSALIAFAIGMSVVRPTAKRVGPLAQNAQQLAEGPERDAAMALVQSLRQRMKTGAQVVALLLLIAVIGMATFRYV